MTTTRILQLADGEELISYEASDRGRRLVVDDPRWMALERRIAAVQAGDVETGRPRF
jgi:hypothetical protein